MTTTVEDRKTETIERIAAGVAEVLQGEEAVAAARFVRACYQQLSLQDLLERDAAELRGAALSLWRLAARREPEEDLVRVYNPALESDGYRSPHTVVEVVHDDMPFLVDSVTGEINRRGRSVHLVVHPVLPTVRDAAGRRVDRSPERPATGSETTLRESLMHVEVDQETSPEGLESLRKALVRVLADVRIIVADFQAMRARLGELLERLETPMPGVDPESQAETRDFLRWFDTNHFTYLGFREYSLRSQDGGPEVDVEPGSGLGLLRDSDAAKYPLTPETAIPAGPNPLLVVSKAGRRSTVHRPVHMDYVGVRLLDERGRALGGWSFVGLFTSSAYNTSATSIPFLTRKVRRVTERAGFASMGHDAKVLLHILETFPRDELFQMTDEELFDTSLGILQLQERQRLALFVRKDAGERFVSCLVYVPRDRYNTSLRQRMQQILEAAFQGTTSAFYTQVADSQLARAHFIIRTSPGRIPEFDPAEIEARLTEASLSWTDRLEATLVANSGEEEGLALLRRYGDAFPVAYRERFEPATAVGDIEEIESLLAEGGLRLDFYRPPGAPSREVRFKIFHTGGLRPLSDLLPMLESMGLEVISEVPYEVSPKDVAEEIWIRALVLSSSFAAEVDPEVVRESFQDSFARVWRGEIEDDAFNRLVLAVGLNWRQVVVVRSYARYLKQLGFAFRQTYMAEILARYPEVTRLLVELFETRFDPTAAAGEEGSEALARTDPASPEALSDRATRAKKVSDRVRSALNAVAKLDEDRLLRRFRNLIDATVRTNFYQRQPDGAPKTYVSFKFDCRRIKGLPRPRPMYEIFVYSPRTEAVHLRGGNVARGGIRWSDRPEDFRTEILGLMKAQMVKNAVIVPVGAKGGFIVKSPPAARPEDAQAAGVESYRTLVRGLLDLTDNLKGSEVVPPPRVVRWDSDDPYLVVAADKGTATFSDIANAVAAEYDFWLGDAFASGGSAGYDHKKMGITARGAWESVKRHFREMGRDPQAEPFTAVGVGDMSGDVFGNGMLLSPMTKLVGAFNHRHIFIDPDPDPARSFAERERLFRLPRSSWEDYDRNALSPGGGIFDRGVKSIPLSPEIRDLLGIEGKSLTPAELIRALLRAPVDLLWFGGIGTFVKASSEGNAATGDRQNDDLRIDAKELRCRVVGEGANLGLTQRGRIEYALAGGRLNTDFIDNSGGVDCSDHEVNFKILLRDVVAGGKMTLEERNKLLEAMTGSVSGLVLRHNYLQSQAISITAAKGARALDEQVELIRDLERRRKLDRALEFLPDDDDLMERRAKQLGLTRPEIAVLLAYSKIDLYRELLASDLPEDPQLVKDLFLYFPGPLRERFRSEVERHRLRREIIATHVTNSMVNRVGPTFVSRLSAATGRSPTDIARAYTISRDTFDLRGLWVGVEELDMKVPGARQVSMSLAVERLVDRSTRWFLARGPHPLQISEIVGRFQPAVARLGAGLTELLPAEIRQSVVARAERLQRDGVSAAFAGRIATLDLLGSACDIVEISLDQGAELEQVARIYFELGVRLRFDALRAAALEAGSESRWAEAATESLVEDLFHHQGDLTRAVLTAGRADQPAQETLALWLGERQDGLERLERLLAEVGGTAAPDLAGILVIEHQLRALAKS